MEETRLWSLSFVFVTLSRAFSSMVFTMLTTILASYVLATYHVDVGMAGIAVGIYIIAALVSRIFAGRYIDLVGRKRMLLIGCASFFLVSFAYFLPVDYVGFLVVRFLHGLAFGVASNTTTVVVTGYIPRDRWGEGMGFFSLSFTLSSTIGPFLGIVLVQYATFSLVFAVCSACALVSFLFACPLKIRPLALSAAERSEILSGLRLSDFFEVKAIPISLLVMVAGACYAGVTSFMNMYADSLGLAQVAPWFFVVNALALLVLRPTTGRLLDRRGENVVMYPALALMAVGYVVLGRCSSDVELLVAAVLFAAGYGTAFSSIQTVVVKRASAHHIGMATSTFYVFADAGMGLGPLLMGSTVPAIGYSGMYLVGAAMSLALVGAYFALHGRKAGARRKRERERERARAAAGEGRKLAHAGVGGEAAGADARGDGGLAASSRCASYVIAIVREHGTGGREIGRRLARELDIAFYGREEMAAYAKERGIADDFAKPLDDQARSKLLYNLFLSSSDSAEVHEARKAVMGEITSRGPCVLVGRAANETYDNVEHSISVFIHAPLAYRIERIVALYGDTRREALDHIERADNARSLSFQFVTGRAWDDPRNYSLVVDASQGVDACVELIRAHVAATVR